MGMKDIFQMYFNSLSSETQEFLLQQREEYNGLSACSYLFQKIKEYNNVSLAINNNKKHAVGIGDLHGSLDAALRLCLESGTVRLNRSNDIEWTGNVEKLLLVGDLVDRGPDSDALLLFRGLLELEAKSKGGVVESAIGNHDVNVIEREKNRNVVDEYERNGKLYTYSSTPDSVQAQIGGRLFSFNSRENPYINSMQSNAIEQEGISLYCKSFDEFIQKMQASGLLDNSFEPTEGLKTLDRQYRIDVLINCGDTLGSLECELIKKWLNNFKIKLGNVTIESRNAPRLLLSQNSIKETNAQFEARREMLLKSIESRGTNAVITDQRGELFVAHADFRRKLMILMYLEYLEDSRPKGSEDFERKFIQDQRTLVKHCRNMIFGSDDTGAKRNDHANNLTNQELEYYMQLHNISINHDVVKWINNLVRGYICDPSSLSTPDKKTAKDLLNLLTIDRTRVKREVQPVDKFSKLTRPSVLSGHSITYIDQYKFSENYDGKPIKKKDGRIFTDTQNYMYSSLQSLSRFAQSMGRSIEQLNAVSLNLEQKEAYDSRYDDVALSYVEVKENGSKVAHTKKFKDYIGQEQYESYLLDDDLEEGIKVFAINVIERCLEGRNISDERKFSLVRALNIRLKEELKIAKMNNDLDSKKFEAQIIKYDNPKSLEEKNSLVKECAKILQDNKVIECSGIISSIAIIIWNFIIGGAEKALRGIDNELSIPPKKLAKSEEVGAMLREKMIKTYRKQDQEQLLQSP